MTHIPFNRGAISPTQCISGGWDLIKGDYGMFLGIALVAMLIAGCIPCLNIFLAGPVMAGVFYCLLTRMSGQYVSFGMMFKGFDKFVPSMVVGLIQAIPEMIQFGVRMTTDVGAEILKQSQRGGRGDVFFAARDTEIALAGGLMIFIIVVVLVLTVLSIALRITFFFVYPLIMEYNLGALDAIKVSARAGWSNALGIFLLMILEGLVAIAGVLALCVGVFLVMPVIHAANAVAYRQVFPPPSGFNPTTPPPPNTFGAQYGNPNFGR